MTEPCHLCTNVKLPSLCNPTTFRMLRLNLMHVQHVGSNVVVRMVNSAAATTVESARPRPQNHRLLQRFQLQLIPTCALFLNHKHLMAHRVYLTALLVPRAHPAHPPVQGVARNVDDTSDRWLCLVHLTRVVPMAVVPQLLPCPWPTTLP